MEQAKDILALVDQRLRAVASANAVVARPISHGDSHVLPLVELSVGLGGGGGVGEQSGTGKDAGSGRGLGAGGGGRATPVAVVIVEGGKVRIQGLEG
jgi:uncharacterized spore protein YtfJ